MRLILSLFLGAGALTQINADMMKAVVAHEYGGAEVLKYEEAPRPEPKENELLVRVIACGVNPADPLVISGHLAKEFGTHLPLIPGYDVAGVVEATGAKVTKFKKGDAVYGYALFGGGWAEYALLAQNEAALKAFLGYVEVLDFTDGASLHYARIRADLKTSGAMIGANDLFIAAHASSLGLTLVTNNTREFGRVRNLILENWTI